MNDHHYAVVVGINRYPALSDLTGARADAEAFAQWLESPDGGALPPMNVRRVMASAAEEAAFGGDAGAAKPVREQIEDAIGEFAGLSEAAVQSDRSVWPRTRLYLYVAGHGLAPSGGEGALYLANAREGASRHLELAEYRKWCTRCAYFHEIVVFADCCRTRQNTARALAPTLDECDAPLNGGQTTWVVGYGSGLGDPTYENDARGYFTTALIEGLRGAPTDETGAVTAATLAPFVKTLVAERTKGKTYPQTAELYADAGARVVFRVQPPPVAATLRVTIAFPEGYAGPVQLVGAKLEVLDAHDAGAGVWQLQLEPGAYGVRPEPGQPEPEPPFANGGLFWATQDGERVQL